MREQNYLPDRPAQADALGRSQFAKSLAHALLAANSSDGFVVGIEGGWGTGKSSVIGFARSCLAEIASDGVRPIVVEFNPWIVSNTGALVEALIGQIAAAINADLGSAEKGIRTGEKLLRYVGLLKHLKYLKYVPGASWAGNAAEDASMAAESVAEAAKGTQEALDDIKKLLPALDLSKRKSEVADALRDLDRPIVVILDDIDRLPPDEIRVVVQAIKAVADFPRTTYLLAYDRDVVAKALGQGDAVAGLSYLEKIVQVAYPIPPLFQYQLRKFVATKVQELLAMLNIQMRTFEAGDLDRAIDLLTMLVRNPRHVVRLLNRLILSLPATHSEVNSVDVLVFEALSQRCPSIREMVHAYPEDFIGHRFRGDVEDSDPFSWLDWADTPDEEDKAPAWEKHLPSMEPDRRIAAKACEFLFVTRDREKGIVAEDRLRIADPDRLARYFRMSSLENVPEASDLHRMLRAPEELAGSLRETDEAELQFQLEWLFNYVPSCSEPDVEGCIDVLIQEASNRAGASGLSENLIKAFEELVERLLRLAPATERTNIFMRIVESAPLGITEHILLQAAAELGKWIVHPEMKKAVGERLIVDAATVDSATSKWSGRVMQASLSGDLAKESSLHSILYRYAQLNYDYAAAYDMVRRLCETDEGLTKFLSRYHENSPFNTVDQFGLVEDARTLAERINSSSIKDQYAWLSRLLTHEEMARNIAEQADRQKTVARPSRNTPDGQAEV